MLRLRDIAHEIKKLIPFPLKFYIKYHVLDQQLSKDEKRIIRYFKSEGIKNSIIFSAFRKSGNTWTRFLICNYFNILINNADRTLSYNELGSVQPHTIENGSTDLFRTGFPELYHTHYPYRKIFKHFSNIIYLYRNPLDTLISLYHMLGNRVVPFYGCPVTERKKFLNVDYYVLHNLPYWIYHYKSTKDKGDVVLCYEEIRKDPFGVFSVAFKKLGFPLDEAALRKSIAVSSFENIKKMGQETDQKYGICSADRFKGEFTRSGKSQQYYGALKSGTIQKARKMLMQANIGIEL